MTYKILIVILIILAISKSNSVIQLDDSNFTTFISKNQYIFVQFYQQDCEICQAIIPQYEKLASQSQGKSYKIAKINVKKSPETARVNKIQDSLILKFIVNGFALDYTKQQTANDIQTFIQDFLNSKIPTINAEQIKTKIDLDERFLVFQGSSDEQLKSLRLANYLDTSIQYYNLGQGQFKITLYTKNKKNHQYTDQSVNPLELKKWIFVSSLPILVPLNSHQQSSYVFQNQNPLPSFMLFKNDQTTPELLSSLEEVCQLRKKQFRCSTIDKQSRFYKGALKYVKASQNQQVLTYMTQKMAQGYKFPNLSQFSDQTLNAFLNNIKEGSINNFLKQNEQKTIQYNNVLIISDDNYSQILKDNEIVLVEYFTSYDPKAHQFASQYDTLAANMKNQNSKYVIAAVNLDKSPKIAEQNYIDQFPAFKLFIKENQIDYNGKNQADKLVKFIQNTLKNRLETVKSLQKIKKPSIAVYGTLSEDSQFHLLNKMIRNISIYHVESDKFSVEIHLQKKTFNYKGIQKSKNVVQYYKHLTSQMVPNILEASPAKKIQKVFKTGGQILTIIKRDETGQKVMQLLQTYCIDKTEYVCGHATKQDGDHDQFAQFIKDPDTSKSRLLFIRNPKFQIFLYEGDLETLTENNLDQFVQNIQMGTVKLHKSLTQNTQDAQKSNANQQQTQKVQTQSDKNVQQL